MTGESVQTEVGSYFITNYPPYSQWTAEQVGEVYAAMAEPPRDVPMGLYLHIPFCRKRCKFCYYKVYTEKNAQDIARYMEALEREIAWVSEQPVIGGRPFRFVYFGGGTPSFISVRQLESLANRLRRHIAWDDAEEVTFECEPGTLSQAKVQAIRDMGVTRLSLGVENFNDEILELNGRAHLTAEIERAWEWIVDTDFPNVNIDLIAGMVGETWETWKETVRRTVEMAPDSVTIYQMELPYNTVFSKEILAEKKESPVADWPTKRAWVDYAFGELESIGYSINSAYTIVKDPERVHFHYRDHLFRGSDLLTTGIASFGHVSGVHYQNYPEWGDYLGSLLEEGKLPLWRAYRPTEEQLLIRETILIMKSGRLDRSYFLDKFGVDILDRWRDIWEEYERSGWLAIGDDGVTLTREGLLRVDSLLPAFFESRFRGVRYT